MDEDTYRPFRGSRPVASWYMIRATAFGEGILEHGVEELMQKEAAYREQ
jgi:hypothetical protein